MHCNSVCITHNSLNMNFCIHCSLPWMPYHPTLSMSIKLLLNFENKLTIIYLQTKLYGYNPVYIVSILCICFHYFALVSLSFYLSVSHTVSILRANSRPYSSCTSVYSLMFGAQVLTEYEFL